MEQSQSKKLKLNLEYLLAKELISPLTEETEEYLNFAAHHESAHAVIGIVEGFNIGSIRINPPELDGGGGCLWPDEVENKKPIEEINEEDIKRLKKTILRAAAGLEAEVNLGRDCSGPARLDFASDDNFITQSCYVLSQLNEDDSNSIEKDFRNDSRDMIIKHWDDIEKIALKLRTELILDREEIKEIVPHLFQ